VLNKPRCHILSERTLATPSERGTAEWYDFPIQTSKTLKLIIARRLILHDIDKGTLETVRSQDTACVALILPLVVALF
jgi:hypothetical protein